MINIVFSCSDWFAPYLSVCLESLRDHISDENNYVVTILEKDISEQNKRILKQYGTGNLTIAFKNVNELLAGKNFSVHGLSIETYFKLFIPLIFRTGKVLFCDADIIFLDDPAKLYVTDLKGKKIGASLCHLWNGVINFNPDLRTYSIEQLGLRNPDAYFQAGILLYQCDLFTSVDFERLFKTAEKKLVCLDQDVLNSCLQDDVCRFDTRWNYETAQRGFAISSPLMKPEHAAAWKAAKENPAIVHYSGGDKPWWYPDEEFADIWWHYARKSPFYELLLLRLVTLAKKQKVITKWTYFRYKLLAKITWGRRRKHYKQKRREAKAVLKNRKERR